LRTHSLCGDDGDCKRHTSTRGFGEHCMRGYKRLRLVLQQIAWRGGRAETEVAGVCSSKGRYAQDTLFCCADSRTVADAQLDDSAVIKSRQSALHRGGWGGVCERGE